MVELLPVLPFFLKEIINIGDNIIDTRINVVAQIEVC